jgi:hypothetical protein
MLELKGSGSLPRAHADSRGNTLALSYPFRFCQHGGNFPVVVGLGLLGFVCVLK